ncbi:hypothetical protein M1446_03680 [Candidatus Dependentiae bacterium]|nr:hypothetical protein [Candidatus Dependentiae bacterium]
MKNSIIFGLMVILGLFTVNAQPYPKYNRYGFKGDIPRHYKHEYPRYTKFGYECPGYGYEWPRYSKFGYECPGYPKYNNEDID